MNPIADYKYASLKRPRDIRLLTLRPALTESQPITCRLQEASLNEKEHPPYEALSYTWGARQGTVPISCDGKTLLVTPNCESALRHLRLKLKSRVLWIDAICIDQTSVSEKNQQVPLMGELYHLATRAIIWLGPGLTGDVRTMKRASITGRMFSARVTPGQALLSEDKKPWVAKLIDPCEIERVRRICGSDWFQRIWTIQELFLAKSAVFLLGRSECPSSALYSYFLFAEALMQDDSRERHLFRMRSTALEMVAADPRARNGWFSKVAFVQMSEDEKADELLSMLAHMAALNDATEVRDKVYGMVPLLLSVVRGSVYVPDIDYSKPVAEVFEEFTRFLLRTNNTLLALELIVSARSDDLPSWVLDLRDPAAVTMAASRYRTCRTVVHVNTEMQMPEWKCSGRLLVRGRYLATVSHVFTRMPTLDIGEDADELRTDCLSGWTAIATDMDDLEPSTWSYVEQLEGLTPYLDYIRKRHDPTLYEQQNIPMKPGRPNSPKHFNDQYDGAALFSTTCGLLGICKGDIRTGDKICQLAGGRYPFVLRQLKENTLIPFCVRRVYNATSTIWGSFHLVGTADFCRLGCEERERCWQKDIVERELSGITLV